MFENELFQLLNDIDKDIDNIDYKRLRDYKTPFIIDRSKNEASLSIFLKYPSKFTVIDGKKMHLDRSFRKVPIMPILEECRRLLVTAMINNRTLIIRLGDSATDFLHTFNDDVVGATLGIIEHDINDDNNYIEYKHELKVLSLNDIQKMDNSNITNITNNTNNNNAENIDNNYFDNDNTNKSNNYCNNSIAVCTLDLKNNDHVNDSDNVNYNDNISKAECKSLVSDLDDYNSLHTTTTDNHTKASHSADAIHQHHRNKADAKVESGQGAFGATEGLGLCNPRPPYKPYSYFPRRVLINGGYGQGKKMESLYCDSIQNTKFHVIITSTHEYDTLPLFLFNGRFGLPSINNFRIIEIFNSNNHDTSNNDINYHDDNDNNNNNNNNINEISDSDSNDHDSVKDDS